jgi:tetratricopeptide (TPR) repeat protein
MELLREALMLRPDYHEARIYLGHAHHVAGERECACRLFREVLEGADDVCTRGFALVNLGNVYLEAGELETAERHFLDLVESGAVQARPQFGLSYFNLALAYGMQGRFEECGTWLHRLYSELPHKRRMIAEEFRSREDFVDSLSRHPEVYENLSTSFPCWFPKREAC